MSQLSTIEKLEQELYDHAVPVFDGHLPRGLKGIYTNDKTRGFIVLSNDLTAPERLSVLAEEAGHYYTSVGNILYLDEVLCRRLERRARAWAYERLVPPEGIIIAWRDYIRTPWELAEYFGVTAEFLMEALECYRQRHAPVWRVDRYLITFEPITIQEI